MPRAYNPMFLPQQMMLTSVRMMQTFMTTYMAASKRLMSKGAEAAEDLSQSAVDTAQDANWQRQEALRRMTNEGGPPRTY